MKLANYYLHPGDNRYLVFEFAEDTHADYFAALLEAQKIVYERHDADRDATGYIMFGVHKDHQREVLKANFMTHGHFRKPLLPRRWMSYLLVGFTLLMTILALIGYYKRLS